MERVNFKSAVKNVLRNWYFPISAAAFFCLAVRKDLGYYIGIVIATIAAMLISSQVPSFIEATFKKDPLIGKIFYGTSAAGICWIMQEFLNQNAIKIKTIMKLDIDISILSIFGAVVAFLFVYICISVFWNKLIDIFKENKIFDDIKKFEIAIYTGLLLFTLCVVAFAFLKSEAFYGTEYTYDVIYTGDSPYLMKKSVYVALTHPENDLRQPLFAVFSAPFVGFSYFVAKVFSATASVTAILVNYAQIILFVTANFMVAKMIDFSPVKRICFMIVSCSTYTYMLFVLMMEQYIVAYFWLILLIYTILKGTRPERVALWGASGTLLTSMVLLPFMSKKSPIKNFKKWFLDSVRYGLEFIAVMLVFCRFDVIFNVVKKIESLSRFTGKNVSMQEKIGQYSDFIKNCFIAPDAGMSPDAVSHISWQLDPIRGLNTIGLIIFALAILSAVLNRDKKSSLFATGWIGMSIVMLVILGWGTIENGLILYSLYFGWAFFVLIFQLVEKIENKLKVKFLIPAFSAACVAALGVINIPAIIEMLKFAVKYFPV